MIDTLQYRQALLLRDCIQTTLVTERWAIAILAMVVLLQLVLIINRRKAD